MLRPLAASLLALGLLASGCSPEAATSRAERTTQAGLITPEPTASIQDILGEPEVDPATVVIAPTPLPDGPRPLVVATILGESGVMAPIDGPALAGVVAEIERLNDEGGVLGRPIELRRFDTNSRLSVTERLAQRVAEDKPDLIITSCDTEFSEPVLDIADANGLLTISPCSGDVRYLTGGLGSRNFTMGTPQEPQGALAAQVAFGRYGPRAIVLRDVTSPEALAFCDGFERAFREIGGTVTYRDEFSYDTLGPLEDRLGDRSEEPSFVVVCSHVPGFLNGAPAIIGIVRSLGFQAPIVGPNTLDRPGWFADVPTLGELLFVSWSSTFGNDPADRVNALIKAARENQVLLEDEIYAGSTTVLGADAILAWAQAVDIAGDATPSDVAAALGSFNNQAFITGEVSFTAGARMDLGRDYRVLLVRDGELTVESIEQTEN